MNKAIVIFLIIFTNSLIAQKDTIPQSLKLQKQAIALAENWVKLVTERTALDSLMNISSLPFALDKKKILNTEDQLKSFYLKMFKEKGERKLSKVTSEIHSSKYEIIDNCIPLNILVVRLKLLVDETKKYSVIVGVKISDTNLKVIGFAD